MQDKKSQLCYSILICRTKSCLMYIMGSFTNIVFFLKMTNLNFHKQNKQKNAPKQSPAPVLAMVSA